ncbi:murein hydrolase activator EnvC family protein [Bdellovibrio sp. HCB337]|uniref:murein hydrolase activator EnvC family protein n=1 Tax=Bdellovibrio sp. HCB337 TaxID=3394358 RepID=UPI0039A757A9
MIKWSLVFLLGTSIVMAEVPPPRDPNLDKIAKDMQIAKENLEIQELRQKKVLTALYSINKNLKKLVTEKASLDQQKNLTTMQIQDLTKKMEENTHQAEAQKNQLTERLRAIYKLKGPTLARFLFAAKSSSDLERNLKVLGVIAQRDLQLIKNYQESVKDLKYRRDQLTVKLASLKDLEADLQVHEKKLQKEISQKNNILAGIRRNKLFTQEQIKELKNKSLTYDLADTGLMDLLLKPSFEAQKGTLPKPVQGPVVKTFGLQKSPDQSYVLSNKGLFISSNPGAPVRAVFSGIVSFAGSLPGLGQVLILDHGDHYYTVYGNNANLRVQLGQEVAQSQVIANSGRSSFDRQNGLYFEIRHFSEPYNPMEWVKGISQ